MTKPRPNTHLDNMLREFKRLAEAGQDLLSITSLACAIGVSNSDFYRHLHKGHEKRFWGLRRDGGRITAIYDLRGAWLLKCSMRRYRDLGGQAVPPRKCLRCREAFQPAHRTNFVCEGCRAFIAQAAP